MQPQRTIGLPACPRYVCTVRADETDETGNQVDTGSTVLQVIVIYKAGNTVQHHQPSESDWGSTEGFGGDHFAAQRRIEALLEVLLTQPRLPFHLEMETGGENGGSGTQGRGRSNQFGCNYTPSFRLQTFAHRAEKKRRTSSYFQSKERMFDMQHSPSVLFPGKV
jgi:hypothetical protein